MLPAGRIFFSKADSQFIYVELVFPRKPGSYVELEGENSGKERGQLNINSLMLNRPGEYFLTTDRQGSRKPAALLFRHIIHRQIF